MRVTDDRYSRDLRRYDLAVRLIRHEARTQTIRQWTGLTDDRIRKLYRSYVRAGAGHGGGAASAARVVASRAEAEAADMVRSVIAILCIAAWCLPGVRGRRSPGH